MSIQRILVVDDDALSRDFLAEAANELGYRAEAVAGGREALARLAEREFHLVLTDMRMPEMDGVELVRRLGSEQPDLPVVVVTAHGSVETAVEAMKLGAADFLLKPCSPDTLDLVVRRIDRSRRLERENRYLRAEVAPVDAGSIVARSPAMRSTLEVAARIAASKGTVLVTGESGTGKERVAQFVHANGPRRDGPFIRVNCAALSPSLLESELFGHEKGAFTGAHKRREGRFELADGGTLLLDEIGEISPALQTKLLRVLEEEEFERVGGTTTLRVDVRVVATTNRDLAAEVRSGGFREDLYYRLHVLPIHVQPLRERREDVLALAQHFLERYARENGRPVPELDHGARAKLAGWTWPGNVRELENTIQRAVVLLDGDIVRASDLLVGPAGEAGPAPVAGGFDPESVLRIDASSPLANRPLRELERIAILSTISASGGNKTEAARRLGVTARTLNNKMNLWRKLGLVA